MSRKKKTSKIPEWINRGRKATLMYDILAAPFEISCDCQTCQVIRENIDFLESVFTPPKLPGGRRGE